MNTIKKQIALILLSVVFASFMLAANVGDWLDIIPNAGSMGLGGAGLNPAALSSQTEIGSTFANLFGQVNQTCLVYSQQFDFGKLSLGYFNIGMDGFDRNTYIPPISSSDHGTAVNQGSFGVNDMALSFGYADNLSVFTNRFDFLKGLNQPWMQMVEFGSVFKVLNMNIDTSTGTGFTVDLGAQYHYDSKLKFGAVLYNFIPLGALGAINWGGTIETLPLKLKVGGAYQIIDDLSILADFDAVGYENSGINLGTEYWYDKIFAFRVGYNKNAFTIGLGLAYQGMKFDFAYAMAPTDYMDATTKFSLGYAFLPVKQELPKEESVTPLPPVSPVIEKPVVVTPAVVEQKPPVVETPIIQLPTVNPIVVPVKPKSKPKPKPKPKPLSPKPVLMLDTPEGMVVKTPYVYLKGSVKNVKTIMMDGKSIPFGKDGHFNYKLALKKGKTTINFKAFSNPNGEQVVRAIRTIVRK